MDLWGNIYLDKMPGAERRELDVNGKKVPCLVVPLNLPAYFKGRNGLVRLKYRVMDYVDQDTGEVSVRMYPVDPENKLEAKRPWLLKKQQMGFLCMEEPNVVHDGTDINSTNHSLPFTAHGRLYLDDIADSMIRVDDEGRRYIPVTFTKFEAIKRGEYTHGIFFNPRGIGMPQDIPEARCMGYLRASAQYKNKAMTVREPKPKQEHGDTIRKMKDKRKPPVMPPLPTMPITPMPPAAAIPPPPPPHNGSWKF